MLLMKLIQLLMTDPTQFVLALLILIVPLLISITVHEWAHGMTAYLFGDPTPKQQGRLSFNPFAHLDPAGTLMLFIVGIGWAKPVMINSNNIHGRHKLMLVALAGPLSNFILATLFVFTAYFVVLLFGHTIPEDILAFTLLMFGFIIRINIALGLFNLIPLPPLDGSNIIAPLLPERMAEAWFRLAPYSMFILLFLVFSGAIRYIFTFAEQISHFLFMFADTVITKVL